jgi:small subunit ribosomal protein S17
MAKKKAIVVEKIQDRTKETGSCADIDCPVHGSLKTRGRTFKGYVTRKLPKRIAIEFERIIHIKKYERFMKKKTRIHTRLPQCMENQVKIGDYVMVQECRPLSKIIHFVFVKNLLSADSEFLNAQKIKTNKKDFLGLNKIRDAEEETAKKIQETKLEKTKKETKK